MGLVLSLAIYPFHLFSAILEIGKYLFERRILNIPVSYPGDAIKNPLKREGKWSSKSIKVPTGWKFACDTESHKISEKQTPKYKLTGESAGRQIWYFSPDKKGVKEDLNFDPSVNPNSADKILRSILSKEWKGNSTDETKSPSSAKEAAIKALSFYQTIQCSDGHWAGDYGGPMFLMPGLICTLYLTKTPFPPGRKEAMIIYLKNHQQQDGGWGTHIECASTMFGTVLNYVALRLLGEDPNQDYMIAARSFIHKYGGALYAPSWAKFWLATIGVYHWDGINSIPAEMWSLPRWFPFHPGKLWCHCRMVYLPMCYIYCKRFEPDVSNDRILSSLRKELYLENYETIDWDSYRQTCASIDEYSPLNPLMKVAQDFLSIYEKILPYIPPLKKLREDSIKFAIDYIHAEDLQTNYVDIGPVNKALNMLSVWIDSNFNNNNEHYQRHIARVDDYLWVAEDGMKMQGYNGSQCWDTSFAIQAIVEGDLAELFSECSLKVYSYLDRTQIANDEENREYYFRHISKGGWPFSTAAHGWPITDCTSEGLKGVLALHKLPNSILPQEKRIQKERLYDSCDVILSYQNPDGGWATYENNRGYRWYELLNPSEVFGDIMIDYSYVECSSACITALKKFSESYPSYRFDEIVIAIKKGNKFLKSIQRKDGSWYGSWGNCFTYGTWFGIEGLIASGEPHDSPAIKKAIEFLLSKQNSNGGWGESYVACVNKAYPDEGTGKMLGDNGSGVVQTSWALLGLMAANYSDTSVVEKGIQFLMKKQKKNGDWDQEGITGVFNRSCAITYTAYRNVFPLWALARYAKEYC